MRLSYLKRAVNKRYGLILDCARYKKLQSDIQHLLELGQDTVKDSKPNTIRYFEGLQETKKRVRFDYLPLVPPNTML